MHCPSTRPPINPADSLGMTSNNLRQQCCVFFRGVDVVDHVAVFDSDIADAVLVRVHDVTSVGGDWRFQYEFDHLAAEDDGMSVLGEAGGGIDDFGNDGPFYGAALGTEGSGKSGDGSRSSGWTIDEGDDGGVASAIEDFLQAGLEGRELSAVGVGVYGEECA